MSFCSKFAATAAFVTRLPFLGKASSDLSGLSKYLPAVGALISAALCLLSYLLHALHINHLLMSVVIVLFWLVITGGIHYDGFMDTADGIFSHRDPQRMLEIMSDSRVGNFGAITGFGLLLLKIAALATLPYPLLIAIVCLAPPWARWCEVIAIGCFPYLKENGMGKIWHDTTTRFDLYLSILVPIALSVVVIYFGSWIALAASAIGVVCGITFAMYIAKVLHGHTGDTYGAVVEITEAAIVFTAALLVK